MLYILSLLSLCVNFIYWFFFSVWTLESVPRRYQVCWYLQNNLLEFWFGLHWLYIGQVWQNGHLDNIVFLFMSMQYIYLYLFCYLISFVRVLLFSSYNTHILLLKYYILKVLFLISNFTCSLLIYSKAIDFCILTLYPITLLQLLISSRSF